MSALISFLYTILVAVVCAFAIAVLLRILAVEIARCLDLLGYRRWSE